MNAATAKSIARQWVDEEARRTPGVIGAFFHGSVNWLADNAVLPATSDVDVMVLLDEAATPQKPGKFCYRDVLLEVSYLAAEDVQTPEQILGTSHLAGSFHTASVIHDPTGHLTALQRVVARDYARRDWVEQRCEHARQKILRGFPLRETDAWPEQVTAWLFPTGITTHVLLLAGLKNPTVRSRYVAVRELLAAYDHFAVYDDLLEQLGSASLSRQRTEGHLEVLAEAFDAASAVIRTPFFFAADISEVGRRVAIDGSREMIARGDHREAIFWMVATWSRCQQIFLRDAPELTERFDHGFRALLADLGIASFADLRRRRDDIELSLPRIWAVAVEIMGANPNIFSPP